MDLEDRSRRNNLRLVGLPEGEEGDNPVAFLQAGLHRWFPSLKGVTAEVDRAHRTQGDKASSRPRTLLFRLLRWQHWDANMKDLKDKEFRAAGTQGGAPALLLRSQS